MAYCRTKDHLKLIHYLLPNGTYETFNLNADGTLVEKMERAHKVNMKQPKRQKREKKERNVPMKLPSTQTEPNSPPVSQSYPFSLQVLPMVQPISSTSLPLVTPFINPPEENQFEIPSVLNECYLVDENTFTDSGLTPEDEESFELFITYGLY